MKIWKKILAVMAIILLIANSVTVFAEDYTEPELFLEKMAEGITQRLETSDKGGNAMTKEEKAAFYLSLVNIELDKIGEFSECTFADKNFNELAHMYIEACKMQQCAAQNYKNDNFYNLLWNGGSTARGGIIVEMYERYDLGLTSAQVDSYR